MRDAVRTGTVPVPGTGVGEEAIETPMEIDPSVTDRIYRIEIVDKDDEIVLDEPFECREDEMKIAISIITNMIPVDQGVALYDQDDQPIDVTDFADLYEIYYLGVLREEAEGSRAELAEVSANLVKDGKITFDMFILHFDEGIIEGYQFTENDFFNGYSKALEILDREDIQYTHRLYDKTGECLYSMGPPGQPDQVDELLIEELPTEADQATKLPS